MSKVVFITGGSSGIGKSIGEYLLNKSYSVYGTSRSPEKYSDSKFPLLSLDMKDEASISNAIKKLLKKKENRYLSKQCRCRNNRSC